jgi:hypothetical protein
MASTATTRGNYNDSYAPTLSLEVRQERSPCRKIPIPKLQLARAILDLYRMGLIEEVVDEKGVPRFRPTEKLL